jgi:hypothetical protein
MMYRMVLSGFLLMLLIGSVCFSCRDKSSGGMQAAAGTAQDSATASAQEPFKFSARPDTILGKTGLSYTYITHDTTARMYKWLVPNPK